MRYFRRSPVFTAGGDGSVAENLSSPMNARLSASRTRAAVALWRIAGGTLLALAIGSLIAVQVSAHAAQRPEPASLDVQPFPGTPDASPQSDISFPALAPSQLRSVTVTGSRSGAHAGHVSALPGGHGTAFTPARPFVSGDHVTVRATLSSPAAGTASGAPDSTRISFSFVVIAPLRTDTAGPSSAYLPRHDIRENNTWTHTFYSENWIHPALVWMNGKDPDPNAGDIFLDVENTYVQAGPMILDPFGRLVWFNPIPNQGAAYNTQVQTYERNQVLTYWEGKSIGHYGIGKDVILDHHYRQVATVNAVGYQGADLHDFTITPQGNAFITVYVPISHVNLSSIGGPKDGTVLDSVIQEINIATGKLLWEWHAYGHVRLSESYAKASLQPFDFFHINSIQQLPNGNLLVSARNTWTVYEINMDTGKIPYNIEGKNSSFKTEPGANFEWQHDAAMLPDGTITLFNDADGYYKSESQSRGMRIALNYGNKTVSLVRSYTASPPLLANTQGSTQLLPDGNVFVGWGDSPNFTEFSGSGTQLFSLHYNHPMESYRAYRFSWWGQPATRPNIATTATSRGTTVYASWNGATDVASWRVLAGPSPRKLKSVGVFSKANFETTMSVSNTEPYFAVQALGSGDFLRATSHTVARGKSG